ncbi:MAG: hypothetical protein RSB10_02265 [Clostridia bacterium]
MNRILKFPENTNEYMQLLVKSLEKSKVDKFGHYDIGSKNIEMAERYILKALSMSKDKKEKLELYMTLGKMYANSGNNDFSNLIFAKVLSLIPREKDLFTIFLANSLCDNDFVSAEYYYNKCADNFLDIDSSLEDISIDGKNAKDALYPFALGEYIEAKNVAIKNPSFKLESKHREYDKFLLDLPEMILGKESDEYVDKIVEFAKKDNLTIHMRCELFVTAAKLCFQCKQYDTMNLFCDKILALDNLNAIAVALQSNYAFLKGEKALFEKSLLDINSIKEERFSVVKEVYNIMDEVDNIQAISVLLDKYVEKNCDFVECKKIKAIHAFNLGEIEKARNLFVNLQNLYGNLVDSKHYLFIINNLPNIKKIKTLEQEYDLLTEYQQEIDRFAELDIAEYGALTGNSEVVLAIDFSVRTGWHFDNAYKVIDKMVNSKNEVVNEILLDLLLLNQSIESKVDIVYSLLNRGTSQVIVNSIDDMVEVIVPRRSIKILKEQPILHDAFNIACAYVIAEGALICDRCGQKEINTLLDDMKIMAKGIEIFEMTIEEDEKEEIVGTLLLDAIGEDGIKRLRNKRGIVQMPKTYKYPLDILKNF